MLSYKEELVSLPSNSIISRRSFSLEVEEKSHCLNLVLAREEDEDNDEESVSLGESEWEWLEQSERERERESKREAGSLDHWAGVDRGKRNGEEIS